MNALEFVDIPMKQLFDIWEQTKTNAIDCGVSK